jgi:transcriptional regulator with XRE-family HTH domain
MTKVAELHKKWMEDPEYQAAYASLEDEFTLAAALIAARAGAGLTQAQLASRMNTTQSVVARLEGGQTRPSTQTLERFAKATGTRLKISFEQDKASSPPLHP